MSNNIILSIIMSYLNMVYMTAPAIQLSNGFKRINIKKALLVNLMIIPATLMASMKEYFKSYIIMMQMTLMVLLVFTIVLVCYYLSKKVTRSIEAAVICVLGVGAGSDFLVYRIITIITHKPINELMVDINARIIGNIVTTVAVLLITVILYKKNVYLKLYDKGEN